MNFLKKLMAILMMTSSITLYAKTMSVNDQILHWTPKMIEHIKTARDVVSDADLKDEAQILLIEWNAFKNNLSARKSNQKVFLQMSKKVEAFLKRINACSDATCVHKHMIQRMIDDVYVGQQKVRGKK